MAAVAVWGHRVCQCSLALQLATQWEVSLYNTVPKFSKSNLFASRSLSRLSSACRLCPCGGGISVIARVSILHPNLHLVSIGQLDPQLLCGERHRRSTGVVSLSPVCRESKSSFERDLMQVVGVLVRSCRSFRINLSHYSRTGIHSGPGCFSLSTTSYSARNTLYKPCKMSTHTVQEEWTANRVRETFLEYFKKNGHTFGTRGDMVSSVMKLTC